jgi:hypothetical protein
MSASTQYKFPSSSPTQSAALKRKLRSLRWHPDTLMREVTLIQRLRDLVSSI